MAERSGRFGSSTVPRGKVEDVGLDRDNAIELAKTMFGARNIKRYSVSEMGSGSISLTGPDRMRGYIFFAPNGTPRSADYVKNAVDAAKRHELVGRDVSYNVDLTHKVAGIKWEKGRRKPE